MNAHKVRFSSVGIIVIVLILYLRFLFSARNPISLFSPCSEIDEPAAFGAKGTIRVILPAYFSMTGGTLDRFGHANLASGGEALRRE
jgi:hypothetical protein